MDKEPSLDRALRRLEIVLRQERRARARRRGALVHPAYRARTRSRLVDRGA